MRLTSPIAGALLAIGLIAADGAHGQSTSVRCERRLPIEAATDAAPVMAGHRLPPDSIAPRCPDDVRVTPHAPMGPGLLRVVGGIGFAATVAQVSNAPEQWPQTTEGMLMRLADRSGVLAMQSLTYRAISRGLAWQPRAAPCPTGVLARARCAVATTLIVHNATGAPRPDLARIASLTLGSAGSLLWRPERRSGGDAAVFVLTRVGSGLAFATVRHALARARTPAPH